LLVSIPALLFYSKRNSLSCITTYCLSLSNKLQLPLAPLDSICNAAPPLIFILYYSSIERSYLDPNSAARSRISLVFLVAILPANQWGGPLDVDAYSFVARTFRRVPLCGITASYFNISFWCIFCFRARLFKVPRRTNSSFIQDCPLNRSLFCVVPLFIHFVLGSFWGLASRVLFH
jgi:hypothetical protein